MDRYKAAIVDDYDSVRDVLVETLRLRDFDAKGYATAEQLLMEAFDSGVGAQDLPDIVVIDLQLEPGKMQGMDLVAELADRSVTSEIMVISGTMTGDDLLEAIKIGAAAGMSKPFDNFFRVVDKMELMAQTGRKRRLYRFPEDGPPQELDASRLHRPVFLSYSSSDRRVASGLRRNLEGRGIPVWYAPSTLEVGDDWRHRIEEGIDRASIFVPLLTDTYLSSPMCIGELGRFHRRLEREAEPRPLMLPVLCGVTDAGRQSGVLRPIIEDYQYVDISKRYIDALTVLFARIERALGDTLEKKKSSSRVA